MNHTNNYFFIIIFATLFNVCYANNISLKDKPCFGATYLTAALKSHRSEANIFMETKICRTCKTEKELSFFSKMGGKKIDGRCKLCRNILCRAKKLKPINHIDGEIWKPIIGFENYYQISNFGRIKALSRIKHGIHSLTGKSLIKITSERLMMLHPTTKGYRQVMLTNAGRGKWFAVHRLIAIHFIPNPLNKPFINHLNGIKHDNRIENLEWCTRSENGLHAFATGLNKPSPCIGEKNGAAKLSEKDVIEILSLRKQGETLKQIAPKFNITFQTVGDICQRKAWKHLII